MTVNRSVRKNNILRGNDLSVEEIVTMGRGVKPKSNQNNELRDAKVLCRAEGDSKAGDTSVDLSRYIGILAEKQNEFKWGRKTDKDQKIDLS